jgi:hypothetical protein
MKSLAKRHSSLVGMWLNLIQVELETWSERLLLELVGAGKI